jgi:hypothetical protein
MRPIAAVLVALWALANLVASFFMVSSTFVAKTAIKEGIPAQAALLLGGVAIEVLSIALVWQSVRILRGR